jgi:hypothetical protein
VGRKTVNVWEVWQAAIRCSQLAVAINDLILHFHDSSQENCPFSATAEYI